MTAVPQDSGHHTAPVRSPARVRARRPPFPRQLFRKAVPIGAGASALFLLVYVVVGLLGFYGVGDLQSPIAFAIAAAVGAGLSGAIVAARWFDPRLAGRILTWRVGKSAFQGVVAAYGGVVFLIGLGRLGVYRLGFAEAQVPPLLGGFYTTLDVVILIIPLGFLLGFFVGWSRTTGSLLLRGFAAYYVDFFRSMPPLPLIFFASLVTALALRGSGIDPYTSYLISLWMGVMALTFHTSAYQAEIMRAGILSVPSGQTEAADAVGISRVRSMFVVTLPQAFRISLPALGNEFSSVIKDTSLLYVIGWYELSGTAFSLLPSTLVGRGSYPIIGSLVIWIIAAFLYFAVTFLVTRTVRVVEDLFKVPGLEVARL
ncbi:MAG: amino acid ABC transporter permease [Thermoplasmata archaeon]